MRIARFLHLRLSGFDPNPATMKVPAFSDIGKATKGTRHIITVKLMLLAELQHVVSVSGDLHPCHR